MSDSPQSETIRAHNEQSLKKLAWALEASQGKFKLIFAHCNYVNLRSRLVQRLPELCSFPIRLLTLHPSDFALYATIRTQLGNERPNALMVLGLESVQNLDQMLASADQVREEFQKNCSYPLVFWLNTQTYKKLEEFAPNLESWGTSNIDFLIAPQELIEFLYQKAEQIFEEDIQLSQEDFLLLPKEIESAQRDCHNLQLDSDQKLRAIIESLLGYCQQNSSRDLAIEHYQIASELWQEIDNLEWLGKIFRSLAFCCYLKSLRGQQYDESELMKAQTYLQQSIEAFEKANQTVLLANSMPIFGRILSQLQDWEQLKNLTERALEFHQKEDSPVKLAEDYGFLAEVYLAEEDWIRANEFARQALELYPIFGNHPEVKHTENISRFNFLLAKTQRKLGQLTEAMATLRIAKNIRFPPPNPQLYINILKELHELYWEDKQYLEAFRIKQEKQSTEQQYGWRAFIGANWLKPKLFEINTLVSSPEVIQETIPLEIIASGREEDVKQLVEKLKRPDYKVIVIHGYSGVGKSSLLNAGLIPILQRTAIAEKTFLPVSIRVYKDWIIALGEQLIKALENKRIYLNRSLETTEAILEELKQCEARNLRVVLIFDQFEEFFFIENTKVIKVIREDFFKFLGECLKILSIKIIFSLRRDYLHYLLDQPGLETIDILSRNVLHKIGNLSVENATEMIKRLIERAQIQLHEDLIQQLVRDLAGDKGEIRPIELQIVGAQLQEEKITTLPQYLEAETKGQLVQRSLNSVVQDCGEENQQLANLVLYLLTDNQGNRPLKTRVELETELDKYLRLDEKKLDLVLTILLGSGLVVKIQEIPNIRYQLIHDYLVSYIQRKQEPIIQELMAQFEQERTERRELETSLQQLNKDVQEAEKKKQLLTRRRRWSSYVFCGVLFIITTIGTIITYQVQQGLKKAQEQTRLEKTTRIKVQATNALEEFKLQQIDGLLLAIKGGRDLQKLIKDKAITDSSQQITIEGLQTILGQIKERNRLIGHENPIKIAQFSPNDRLIVTASEDSKARIWDISGRERTIFKKHIFPIYMAQFSPDGTKVVTASEDHTARVWNLAGKESMPLMSHKDIIYSAQFSPNGRYIVTASLDKTARIWDSSGRLLRTLRGHSKRVTNAHFSPDSTLIVTTSFDGTARIWNLSGREIATLGTHRYAVNNAEFSPNGRLIVTASDDGTAKIWDSFSKRELHTLRHHWHPVVSAQFSYDGKYIVTASADKTAKIWNLSGKKIATLKGHLFPVLSAQFSPNGKYIVTASDDGTTKIWNLKGELIATLEGHQYPVRSAQFSHDGQYIVTASDDGTARIWSVHGQNPETLKNLSLEQLLNKGCEWVKDYLTHNPEGKKHQSLCPDLFKQGK